MANPNLEQMRSKITEQYENPKWKARVATMTDKQIIAIYYRMREAGRFVPQTVGTLRKGHKDRKKPIEQYHQMTIFDYI